MQRRVRILHLEDDSLDSELIRARLDAEDIACDMVRVRTGEEFERFLRGNECDLILGDYALPGYDGISAFRAAQKLRPETPFIFVSGTMGEDAAIQGLTEGATDYVLKDRLLRLGPAVRRALAEAENRRERRRAEATLRKLSLVVEQSANTIVITDTEGYIEYANPAFAVTTGYSTEEVRGQHTRILKSGHTSDAEYADLWRTVKAGGKWRGTFLNKKKDGEVIWQSASISPIKDVNGNITNFLAVEEDISDLRDAQEARENLEEQLRHAQRLEALGTLAGGIAHDFNNILGVIVGYSELAVMAVAEDSPLQRDFGHILQAAKRGTKLCDSLLVFGRKRAAQLRPLDLNSLIEGTRNSALRLLGEDVESILELAAGPLTVLGDAGQLEQVLMNFATNSRDAMPEGGVLTVRTEVVAMDSEFIRTHGFGAEGDYACITVSDTGRGMDATTIKRIFEPFFTTKGVGRGTGLGMSIVYGIVKQHQGFIRCKSELGQGTEMMVFLPLLPRGTVVEEGSEELAEPTGGHETVLVADDDGSTRQVLRRILEDFGYTVIEARDGDEAVHCFSEQSDRIDVIVMDAMMPRRGGLEAFEEIRRTHRDAKAVFVTGYLEDSRWHQAIRDLGAPLIQKPVRPRELVTLLRQVLDGSQ